MSWRKIRHIVLAPPRTWETSRTTRKRLLCAEPAPHLLWDEFRRQGWWWTESGSDDSSLSEELLRLLKDDACHVCQAVADEAHAQENERVARSVTRALR